MSLHRNPKALLTPAMHSVLERMTRAGLMPLHALTSEQARTAYNAGAGVLELPVRPMARVEDFHVTTRDGYALPVRLVAPSKEVCQCWCISMVGVSPLATSKPTMACAANSPTTPIAQFYQWTTAWRRNTNFLRRLRMPGTPCNGLCTTAPSVGSMSAR